MITSVPVAFETIVCGSAPGVIATPLMVTLATPSGELKVMVEPVASVVSELLTGLPSAISPEPTVSEPRGGRPPSSTTVPSPMVGTSTVSGASPMVIVSVAVSVLPSWSTMV